MKEYRRGSSCCGCRRSGCCGAVKIGIASGTSQGVRRGGNKRSSSTICETSRLRRLQRCHDGSGEVESFPLPISEKPENLFIASQKKIGVDHHRKRFENSVQHEPTK